MNILDSPSGTLGIEFPVIQGIRYQPDSKVDGDIVEFRLIYRGPLPAASASDTRSDAKHRIRCEFNRQLKVLWREHPALRGWETIVKIGPGFEGRTTADVWADRLERCGIRFLPLIDSERGLACSLDILFLRRDQPGGFIVSGGDIDNRIKVLFDALRVPQGCNEIPKGWNPSTEENPFYCVMEDDKLITEVNITTDRLLSPQKTGEHQHDVMIVLNVKSKIVVQEKSYIEFL